LLWAKGLSANAIQSQMRPVYGVKCFTRPAIHVWCKKFAYGRESVVDEEEPGRCVVSTTDATIAAVDSLTLKNETLMFDVSTRLLVGLVHFSRLIHNVVQHSRGCKRKLLGKILHWLRSKYK